MKRHEVDEVIACLPKGRTLYTYGKDWYAIQLLRREMQGEMAITELKKTSFGKLLNKPRVKRWLGSLGKSTVNAEDLALLWPDDSETFRLTLGRFDGCAQTSRRGKDGWNLVLQMNLNEADARFVEKAIPERSDDPFEWLCHPIHEGRHRTLAWARIDIDWDSGEALIEEIQNDRLREVKELLDFAQRKKESKIERWGVELSASFLRDYWKKQLRVARDVWDEAMLSAAIQLIVDELGIRRIYYHTHESGSVYKGVGAEDAPKSLYTTLPKKFCFQKTQEAPRFLSHRFKRNPNTPFHVLDWS